MAQEPTPQPPPEPETESSELIEDEVPTEDHEATGAETQASELATVEVLAQEVEELRARAAERDEFLDRLQRTTADFINYQKRQQRERERWTEATLRDLLLRLLPALDDLDRALAAARQNHDAEALLRGVELIQSKLAKAIEDEGVKPIQALGQPFDPAYHQAVAQAERRDVTDQTVVEIARRGYLLGDRILRAAQVVVSKGGPPPLPPAPEPAPGAKPESAEASGGKSKEGNEFAR